MSDTFAMPDFSGSMYSELQVPANNPTMQALRAKVGEEQWPAVQALVIQSGRTATTKDMINAMNSELAPNADTRAANRAALAALKREDRGAIDFVYIQEMVRENQEGAARVLSKALGDDPQKNARIIAAATQFNNDIMKVRVEELSNAMNRINKGPTPSLIDGVTGALDAEMGLKAKETAIFEQLKRTHQGGDPSSLPTQPRNPSSSIPPR